MELIKPPRIEQRPELPCIGIRLVTPFRGMFKVRDDLLRELYEWLDGRGVAAVGPFFLRLHVIDMEGPMEIEVGAVTPDRLPGDARVSAGVLPAGPYATLTYRDHARRANSALIDWAKANGVVFDRSDDPMGDRFTCRYEAYVTDPRTEPRKTRWEVELNIRVVQ
ncbi:GyrI-like domain-containing protein [Nonomuraea basaltis]|uniref:GyrI-like domain-containing protein n=1 Tax=Nonomuraea basaltis TaxID=2495887 RepID=UPI001486D7F5|nr:GyrI-like domain-containing protein [Nonomuraea basaltis]